MGIQQNLANVMSLLREERGKSLAEFSQELQISKGTLQKCLNGTANLEISTIETIAACLDVDPVALLSGVFEPGQLRILHLLLETNIEISKLTPEKRARFAELFLDMISLWGGDEK